MELKKLTRLSGLLALSVVLGYFENLVPLFNGTLPGVKIGLANCIVLLILYGYGEKEAILISITRVFLVSLFSTGIFSIPFFFSLTGAILSILVMILAKRFTKFSMIGVSILGSISHCTGQIICAVILLEMPSLFHYYPWLFAFSIPTGLLIGVLSKSLYEELKNRNLL